MIYIKEIAYSRWNDHSGWENPTVYSTSIISEREANTFAKNAASETLVGEPNNYLDWVVDIEVNRDETTDIRWVENIYAINGVVEDFPNMDAEEILENCNITAKTLLATDFVIESEAASRIAEKIVAARPGLIWKFGG